MKKGTKVFLWISFGVLAISFLGALSVTTDVEASLKDVLLYRASGASLLFLLMVGILLELDIFHIKSKLPFLKDTKVTGHVIFWVFGFWCQV